MVVDLIGIYGLKGPYFLETESIGSDLIGDRSYDEVSVLDLTLAHNRRLPLSIHAAAAADLRRKFVSGQLDEENPFVLISSSLIVQPDEGVSVLVVDRIGDNLPQSTEKSRILVIPVGARHKCQQDTSLKLGRPYPHFDGPID
ncbi:GDP-L-galactose phosphorylase 2-like [Dorcoceras hygrometricum]|uniref:GDP-L-galactose phosphorylase 2-like n=1 Tax=Dorcoceras hygrometricum TaxID=472368 RepID=A0A2Z7BQK1_9LAMI|nr:GDP-L-galactose phosphorylase 2-like [Dorcoceras hygrometricum]